MGGKKHISNEEMASARSGIKNSDFLIPKSFHPNVVVNRFSKNYVRSNNPSLKYQRFTQSGCRDIGFRSVPMYIFMSNKPSPE